MLQTSAIDSDEARPEASERQRRVIVVLPFEMSVRNFVTSPVAAHLATDETLEVMIVSRNENDRAAIEALPGHRLSWQPIMRPFQRSTAAIGTPRRRIRLLAADVRAALGHYLSTILVYRFNSINRFRGFLDRLKQSRALRRLAIKEGLPLSRCLGFPLPANPTVFRILKALYHSDWQRHPLVEETFDRFCPDVLVIAHLQHAFVTPYVLAAMARGVPILGINGSWDQPTTKGPLMPAVKRVLAQSRQVVDDLATLHGVPREAMEVVGWPQMDIYADAAAVRGRAQFLTDIGLVPGARYILVAAYTDRLGAHEPAMCRALSMEIERGRFGPGAALFVRSHPLDRNWQKRLGALARPPSVIVEPPSLGALDHLANLIRHAEVVISSAGTINLDAAALDTPSIAVAFEDEEVPYYDRAARRYDMEHVAAVMASGGIRKAASLAELIEVTRAYMADRGRDAAGRAALRAQHLAPLDGNASRRIAEAIGRFARAHAARQEAGR